MNKKVLTSSIALALCLAATAPIYKYLTLDNTRPELSATQQSQQINTMQYKQPSDVELLKSELMEQRRLYGNTALSYKTVTSEVQKPAVQSANTKAATTTKHVSTSGKTAVTAAKKTMVAAAKRTTVTTKPATSVSSQKTTVKRTASKSSRSTSGTVSPSSKATAVINTAKSFMGVPYVWGGTSPSGFDCSGFTQYVLQKNGISIPRVTSDQYKAGVGVSKANLRVGDLVFFTTYKPGPSHVGFYLGNGDFIHASSSKGVTISNINSSYYSSRYIGARRVI